MRLATIVTLICALQVTRGDLMGRELKAIQTLVDEYINERLQNVIGSLENKEERFERIGQKYGNLTDGQKIYSKKQAFLDVVEEADNTFHRSLQQQMTLLNYTGVVGNKFSTVLVIKERKCYKVEFIQMIADTVPLLSGCAKRSISDLQYYWYRKNAIVNELSEVLLIAESNLAVCKDDPSKACTAFAEFRRKFEYLQDLLRDDYILDFPFSEIARQKEKLTKCLNTRIAHLYNYYCYKDD